MNLRPNPPNAPIFGKKILVSNFQGLAQFRSKTVAEKTRKLDLAEKVSFRHDQCVQMALEPCRMLRE